MSPTLSSEQALLDQVATSLATLDATLYEQINAVSEQGNLGTADLLDEVSRDVSKALWFVETHLQAGASRQNGAGRLSSNEVLSGASDAFQQSVKENRAATFHVAHTCRTCPSRHWQGASTFPTERRDRRRTHRGQSGGH